MNYFREAVAIIGGQVETARLMQFSQSIVSQMATGERPIPAGRCRQLEFLTKGKVTRYQLRPDIFGTSARDKEIYVTESREQRVLKGKQAPRAPEPPATRTIYKKKA